MKKSAVSTHVPTNNNLEPEKMVYINLYKKVWWDDPWTNLLRI